MVNARQDFRSEHGLYSMIQKQYDTALLNPPWLANHQDEQQSRPAKRRKVSERYTFEVLRGEDVIESQLSLDAARDLVSGGRSVSAELVSSSATSYKSTNEAMEDLDEAMAVNEQIRRERLQIENQKIIGQRARRQTRSEGQRLMTPPLTEQDSHPQTTSLRFADVASIKPASISSSQGEDKDHLDQMPKSPPASQCIEPPNNNSYRSCADNTAPRQHATSHKCCARTCPSSLPATGNGPSRGRRRKDRTVHACQPGCRVSVIVPNKRSMLSKAPPTLSRSETSDTVCSQSSTRSTLPNLKGKDLFDAMIWQDAFTTSIFYMFITSFRKKIWEDVKLTTRTHKFIRVLRDNKRLIRNYTQNIDCLEERESLTTNLSLGTGSRGRKGKRREDSLPIEPQQGVNTVLLHGSLNELRCNVCSKLSQWDETFHMSTSAGLAPQCPSCLEHSEAREKRGRRAVAVGQLRPNIVLYGEEHPNAQQIAPLITHDLAVGPDLLLIMGTSLRVHGLKIMVREFAKAVHSRSGKVIFVNQTKPPESIWGDVIDYHIEWDCDAWVLDLEVRRPDIWSSTPSTHPKTIHVKGIGNRTEKAVKNTPVVKKKPRSQRLDNDRRTGVHITLTILDTLAGLHDEHGNRAPRKDFIIRPSKKSTGQQLYPDAKTATATAGHAVRQAVLATLDDLRCFQDEVGKTAARGLLCQSTSHARQGIKTGTETSGSKASRERQAMRLDTTSTVSVTANDESTPPFWHTSEGMAYQLSPITPLKSRARDPLDALLPSTIRCNTARGISNCPANLQTHPPLGMTALYPLKAQKS